MAATPGGMSYALDFERPLLELEKKIEELKGLSATGSVDFTSEIAKLEKKAKKLQTEIFSDLSRCVHKRLVCFEVHWPASQPV